MLFGALPCADWCELFVSRRIRELFGPPNLETRPARLRSPGERAGAQLKTWHILRKLRCCPWRAGLLAQAIHVLQAREIAGCKGPVCGTPGPAGHRETPDSWGTPDGPPAEDCRHGHYRAEEEHRNRVHRR